VKAEKRIIDSGQLKSLWSSLTGKIINDYPTLSNLAVVGVRCRGDILAARMVEEVKRITGKSLPLGILDITLYRDDFTMIGPEPVVRKTEINFDIQDKEVILVDDVIFTGRTTRAALDELIDFGRPTSICLAVLIDRGGRELPIQPDYVGKRVTINPGEIVEVRLEEFDGKDEVVVTERKLKERKKHKF